MEYREDEDLYAIMPVGQSMGFGKNDTGVIIRDVTAGALGAVAATAAVTFAGPAITDDFRMLKMESLGVVTGLTNDEAESLIFGIANADLTAAQIADAINLGAPLNRADRDLQEQAMRNVKIISQLQDRSGESGAHTEMLLETVGLPVVSKHRWTYTKGVGWDYFIYNRGSAALTTGAIFRSQHTIFGLWL